MKLDDLAKILCNEERLGLNAELMKKLGIASADVTRGRLMAQVEEDRSHLGVYLLAAYVVDDTDAWGDGEVYWWCIPTMVGKDGKVTRNVLHQIPTGGAPHKVGSLEWMTNFSMKTPPLVAVIPPEEGLDACVLRVAFYDDDAKPANVPLALQAGLETYASLLGTPMQGAEQIITPVRDAIWKSLEAAQDDILIDQDITIRRGTAIPFASGMIGSVMNAKIHLYYFVKDENRTLEYGPVTLHKGQTETVTFSEPITGGGRVAIFARGGSVTCSAFGELNTETPFQNRIIDSRQEAAFSQGFTVTADGPAKFVAYYTPGG